MKIAELAKIIAREQIIQAANDFGDLDHAIDCFEEVVKRSQIQTASKSEMVQQKPGWEDDRHKIREAFARYVETEGCSCCRDTKGHEAAKKELVELLNPLPYNDGSGWDWDKPA